MSFTRLHSCCFSFTHSFAQIQQNNVWFVILAGTYPKNLPIPTLSLSISFSLLPTHSHLLSHTRSFFLSFFWSHIYYNNERVRRLVYWLQSSWKELTFLSFFFFAPLTVLFLHFSLSHAVCALSRSSFYLGMLRFIQLNRTLNKFFACKSIDIATLK